MPDATRPAQRADVLDFDAARAARREAKKEGPKFKLGGKTFKLPVELPFDVPEALGEVAKAVDAKDDAAITAAISMALRLLLGKDYDRFRETRPSMEDVQVVLKGTLTAYGIGGLPEPSALES